MYKLSTYIELFTEVNKNNELDFFILITKKKTRDYIVNQSIFTFLKHFETPLDFESLFEIYKNELKLNSEEELITLKKQIELFFNDLISKGWIVNIDTEEIEFNFITQFQEKDNFLNYKILKVLANNKLTDVYLVKDKKNKKFVLKVLNINKFDSIDSFNKYSSYFKLEYYFLTKFNSNYINRSFGYEYYNNQPFIVLENITGISLSKYIKRNTLSKTQKSDLVLQILKGFSLIHKAKVYHGDVHLSNILVKQNLKTKIIDFGYSNEADVTDNSIAKIRNGGVYAFIPPERAKKNIFSRFTNVIQYQSEVYQIGLLVYYIYVKKLPFEAITWKTMVDEKSNFNIRTYHLFTKKRMPNLVREFIIKCLENNPEDRYKNAQEMLKQWQIIKRKL